MIYGIVFGEVDPPKVERVVLNALATAPFRKPNLVSEFDACFLHLAVWQQPYE
jgi:hypothetical protein